MMKNSGLALWVSASLLAYAAVADAALAQSSSAETDSNQSEEVVVTALKQTEKLQDAPSTIDVVTSENATERGITDIRGITNLAPSILLGAENTATQVYIRGIGQSSDGDSNSPAVAVNFDGVYTPRYAVGTSMFDIEQVEVLPGPQGLLYGQNAAGGAINVNSRRPGNTFEADGIVEGGNYGLFHASGGADIPVSDTLNLRAAIDYLRHDGYLSDGQNDADSISGRLTADWRPSEALSVVVRGEIDTLGGKGAGIVAYPLIDPHNPWYEPTASGDHFYNHETVEKLNAEIKYSLDSFTVTYIPAYVHYGFGYRTPLSVPQLAPALLPLAAAPYGGLLSNGQPGGYFAAALNVPSDAGTQYTNELRFNSNNSGNKSAGTLSWLAGFFQLYTNVDIPQGDGVDIYNPAAASGGSITPYSAVTWGGANSEKHQNDSYAAFGQLTYAVTDRLRINGGARYSLDRLHAVGVSQTYLPGTPVAAVAFSHGALVAYNGTAATPAQSYNVGQIDHHIDWKVGAEFDVSPTSLLYGSVQTGYNQGGFNLALLGTPQVQFQPEHLIAYTVGTKNSFFDNRLIINDELFYYDYDNLQVASFDAAKGSGFRVNVPKSAIYGDQIDVQYRIWTDTILNIDAAWLDAYIVRGVLGPAAIYGGTTQYPTCSAPINPTLCSGGGSINYAGSSLGQAPPLSITASLRHSWYFAGGSHIEALVATHFDAPTWDLYAHIPGTHLAAFTMTDLTLTYHSASDWWSIGAWAKNLENTPRADLLATDNIYGQAPALIEPPRTFGLRLGFKVGG